MNDNKKNSRWFTVVDALIILIVLGFIIGAAVLFTMPRGEETGDESVRVSLQLQINGPLSGLRTGDKAFFDGVEIGSLSIVDEGGGMVVLDARVEKGASGYSAGDTLIRINGAFILETKLCYVPATVIAIEEK